MPNEEGKGKKVGLRFSETMSGYLAEGVEDFEEGERKGREQGNTLSFDVKIEVECVSDFIKLSGQKAKITGTVSYAPLGQSLPLSLKLKTISATARLLRSQQRSS